MSKEVKKVTSNITIEGAQLIFRNFSGEQTEFNAAGNRNFGVLLDDELAGQLARDGWNVKRLKPRPDDPDMHEQAWLPVKVKFGKIPPIVVMITSRGKVKLDEESVGQLDWTKIENADLIVRPYNYAGFSGRPAGVSAYLKTLYVTIEEDVLSMKYAETPDLEED